MKILLIAGGWSSEREVSLNGARGIEKALKARGHEVDFFDLAESFGELALAASNHDFAFLNLHGAPGEDGLVQAILERAGCPYQGSGPGGSMLALHKTAAKQLFRFAGLPTAPWEFLPVPPPAEWRPSLPYPLFVKSDTGGSSINLARANDWPTLKKNLEKIFAAAQGALIEPELKGREITCAVLGQEALPPILIEPLAGDFFDYESKYARDGAREICPAPIGPEASLMAQKLALQAHATLGLEGYSRTDFILDDAGKFTILEVNTLPGMTETSLVPQEAAAIGMDFSMLLERLIELGLENHKKRKERS